MNVAQIKEMLELQHQLNAVINPDWKTAKNPWTRAIWVESAELLDHIGWKWWKAQSTNVAQAHIELVDIWHFILSQFAETGDDMDVVASELHHRLFDQGSPCDLYPQQDPQPQRDEPARPRRSYGFARCQRLRLHRCVRGMLRSHSFDAVELRRIYVGKNVLNLFRQANGYKQGTYIKNWNGVEDNVRLEETMKSSPHLSPADLFKQLGFAYARVQKEPA